jgi:TolA-binding protein
MLGLEMMLQSFGVDTEQVKRNVEGAVQLIVQMNEQLAAMNQRLDGMNGKLDSIAARLPEREQWPPEITQTWEELKAAEAEASAGGAIHARPTNTNRIEASSNTAG